jgi:hypothetical protein
MFASRGAHATIWIPCVASNHSSAAIRLKPTASPSSFLRNGKAILQSKMFNPKKMLDTPPDTGHRVQKNPATQGVDADTQVSCLDSVSGSQIQNSTEVGQAQRPTKTGRLNKR